MKAWGIVVATLFLYVSFAYDSMAHFGMVIPSETTVMDNERANISLDLKFWHPFENRGMNLVKPAAFDAYFNGDRQDLLNFLKESKKQGKTVWSTSYKISRPGLFLSGVAAPLFWWAMLAAIFAAGLMRSLPVALVDNDNSPQSRELIQTLEAIPSISFKNFSFTIFFFNIF